jgi:hypothetical protein
LLEDDWTHHGKVRAREAGGELTIIVDGLTTQGKYYKPLIYEFFRKSWRGSRPAWGEFSVEIGMEYVGEPPWIWTTWPRLCWTPSRAMPSTTTPRSPGYWSSAVRGSASGS